MSKTLDRVLRLRSLVEETSRLELEAASQQQRRLELKIEDASRQAHISREGAFDGLQRQDAESWLLEEGCCELAEWQGSRLRGLAQEQASRVAALREAFLQRRKETRQVETLLSAYNALLQVEQGRREQAALDEWFNLRRQQTSRRRHALSTKPGDPFPST